MQLCSPVSFLFCLSGCETVNCGRFCFRQLWFEHAWAACRYDEFDNALEVMMAHDAVAWEHVRFKDVAVKCSTVDIFYKAIQHYFDFHPDLVNDLLKVRPSLPHSPTSSRLIFSNLGPFFHT